MHSTTVQHRYLATTPLATALGTDDVEQHDQGNDPKWGTTLEKNLGFLFEIIGYDWEKGC